MLVFLTMMYWTTPSFGIEPPSAATENLHQVTEKEIINRLNDKSYWINYKWDNISKDNLFNLTVKDYGTEVNNKYSKKVTINFLPADIEMELDPKTRSYKINFGKVSPAKYLKILKLCEKDYGVKHIDLDDELGHPIPGKPDYAQGKIAGYKNVTWNLNKTVITLKALYARENGIASEPSVFIEIRDTHNEPLYEPSIVYSCSRFKVTNAGYPNFLAKKEIQLIIFPGKEVVKNHDYTYADYEVIAKEKELWLKQGDFKGEYGLFIINRNNGRVTGEIRANGVNGLITFTGRCKETNSPRIKF